jgi:hypothetical protein
MNKSPEESELLKIRSRYGPATGWETARAWLFKPNNEDQIRMGVARLLENNLISDFMDHAGVNTISINDRGQWKLYKQTFAAITTCCNREALGNLLWAVFLWSKGQDAVGRGRYLREAVGPIELVSVLAHEGLLKPLLTNLIQKENPKQSLPALKATFEGVEQNPGATAILVIDFIYTVRDIAGEDNVLSAFFEGFELTASYGTKQLLGASIKWTASPMLKALARSKGRATIDLYENLIRDLFSKARKANADNWAEWQRAYDQEYLFWTNILQAGMVKPDTSLEYKKLE